MKQKIIGSAGPDANLERSVCTHLLPIAGLLWERGLRWDPRGFLHTDKGGAHSLIVDGAIPFDDVEAHFELPSFIEANRRFHSIICRKCWCDITERGHEDQ